MGSYKCSCQAIGHSLDNDEHNCSGDWLLLYDSLNFLHYILDINECDTDNGGCEQICTNTVPFYNCSCYSGFKLVHDKFVQVRLYKCT